MAVFMIITIYFHCFLCYQCVISVGFTGDSFMQVNLTNHVYTVLLVHVFLPSPKLGVSNQLCWQYLVPLRIKQLYLKLNSTNGWYNKLYIILFVLSIVYQIIYDIDLIYCLHILLVYKYFTQSINYDRVGVKKLRHKVHNN